METTARNRTIGGIVIGAIILILLLVLFSCTVSGGDPNSSPQKDPTTGESSSLPSDPDTLEPGEDPSESESDDPEEIDGDDIVPAANTGVTFIPAGNIPSASTPTCELDKSACEPVRPPNAGVDICEIRPDLTQCQPEPVPTPDPGDGDEGEDNEGEDPPVLCGLPLLPPCGNDDDDDDDDGEQTPNPVMRDVECKDVGTTSLKLSWPPAKDDKHDIAGYVIRGNHGIGEHETTTPGGEFTGLQPGTDYRFDVRAVDGDGNESEWVEKECPTKPDTEDPQTPPNLKVAHITGTTAHLEWNPSKDDSRVDHYEVTWTSSNGDSHGPVETDGTTYYVTDLTPDTNYTFTVVAVDIVERSSAPASVDGTTKAEDTLPPEVPTNVEIVKVDENTLRVTWRASADDQSRASDVKYNINFTGVAFADGSVTGETTYTTGYVDLLPGTIEADVTATDEAGNTSEAGSGELTLEEQRQMERQTPEFRTRTQDPAKSGAPSEEAPVEVPAEKKSPLPTLEDILTGGDDSAEAPAEPGAPADEPAAEAPAEEPTEEPSPKAAEEAPAEEPSVEKEDEGVLEKIGDAVTTAVTAVF